MKIALSQKEMISLANGSRSHPNDMGNRLPLEILEIYWKIFTHIYFSSIFFFVFTIYNLQFNHNQVFFILLINNKSTLYYLSILFYKPRIAQSNQSDHVFSLHTVVYLTSHWLSLALENSKPLGIQLIQKRVIKLIN